MIEFKHVSFAYDSHGEQEDTHRTDDLHDINLKVNDGECILLCGKKRMRKDYDDTPCEWACSAFLSR